MIINSGAPSTHIKRTIENTRRNQINYDIPANVTLGRIWAKNENEKQL